MKLFPFLLFLIKLSRIVMCQPLTVGIGGVFNTPLMPDSSVYAFDLDYQNRDYNDQQYYPSYDYYHDYDHSESRHSGQRYEDDSWQRGLNIFCSGAYCAYQLHSGREVLMQ
ncbi:uncharacterized protein LOC111709252 [Eurytemora carolleeae]|uniref:uncharacterized protein LOC111709252 n=1 Tax=Eurytemora carolleeae TaxID=1294199 RepID=UPI000C776E6A|nr:uncharacterized protein LOC111709252 [Eurytemora carolleeae]|eukprot:XP_023338650.1 uncharacterized protein LOC111709252 [Eurytemora affinis]